MSPQLGTLSRESLGVRKVQSPKRRAQALLMHLKWTKGRFGTVSIQAHVIFQVGEGETNIHSMELEILGNEVELNFNLEYISPTLDWTLDWTWTGLWTLREGSSC